MSSDFLLIDELYTEEERLTRDEIKKFVDKRFKPLIRECFREGKFPLEIVEELGRLGVFGSYIKGYTCAGTNFTTYGLMMEELERGDSGLRSFASVQGSLTMGAIYYFGSEEQKRYWLPLLASGKKIGAFALTEPDFGSNPAGMKTRARKDRKTYIINGSKMWITNGHIADVVIVWAKTGEGPESIRGFIVEKGTRGFEGGEIKDKISFRASITSELFFDECKIPEENLLPKTEGLKSALTCLNNARFSIAYGVIGAMRDCYEEALKYSLERVQFDCPIAGHQLVQEKLVFMLTEMTKAKLLAYRVGRMMDEGKAKHYHISMAKMNNVKSALEVARTARDIFGAAGITLDHSVMRHLVNLETVFTYEGTHNIHTLIIGRHLTGIPAF
jgi:glutaryl-CoA dehydrogenase